MNLSRYMELFQGRDDVFAQQHKDGSYTPVRRPLEQEDVWSHLQGEWTIGFYVIQPASVPDQDGNYRAADVAKTLVFDVDTQSVTPVISIIEVLQEYGVFTRQYLLEFSGRKGYHLWLFMDRWETAADIRRAGLAVLRHAGVECEVFPKQDTVASGYGNLIKFPLGVHQVSGDGSRFIGGCHPWEVVQPLTPEQFDVLREAYDEKPREKVTNRPFDRELPPCMLKLQAEGVSQGKRDSAMFGLAVELKDKGKSQDEALEACLETNAKCSPPLPVYVIRQKVRSAFSGEYLFKCSSDYLHDRNELLCKSTCPRYQPSFGAAR